TAQGQKHLVDVQPPLRADGQAPKAPQPGNDALDHPAVPPRGARGLDPQSGDAYPDLPKQHVPARHGASRVGMDIVRTRATVAARTAGSRVRYRLVPQGWPTCAGWPHLPAPPAAAPYLQ